MLKILKKPAAIIGGAGLSGLTRIITAPRVEWNDQIPGSTPRVYFSNHRSNADTVLIWSCLPPRLRRHTRPAAAADYWLSSPLRRFVGKDIFNIIPVERNPENRTGDPVQDMADALDQGSSIIIFPEGRRNESEEDLLAFKTGIYHLAKRRPETGFVPVWVNNLNGVLPRGEIIPVPLICSVTFGQTLTISEAEDKTDFLGRTRSSLLSLSPQKEKKT